MNAIAYGIKAAFNRLASGTRPESAVRYPEANRNTGTQGRSAASRDFAQMASSGCGSEWIPITIRMAMPRMASTTPSRLLAGACATPRDPAFAGMRSTTVIMRPPAAKSRETVRA